MAWVAPQVLFARMLLSMEGLGGMHVVLLMLRNVWVLGLQGCSVIGWWELVSSLRRPRDVRVRTHTHTYTEREREREREEERGWGLEEKSVRLVD